MRILRLRLRHFRGFDDLTIHPAGHVILVGEPGAGRSDLVEALRRLLSPDSTRFPLSEPTDFHGGDLARRAEVEAVIGELDQEYRQLFFDRLEVWNRETRELVMELNELDELEDPNHEWVVRLCYRARWDPIEKQGEHWVDYPKVSDPDANSVIRVPRPDRERIPFALVQPASRALDLSPRATFRRVVDESAGEDFPDALEQLRAGLEQLAEQLSRGSQVRGALDQVLGPVRLPLDVGNAQPDEVVRFLPEGGAMGAIVRSLGAAVDLFDGSSALPLTRHGSTVQTLIAISEAIFAAGPQSGIVVADDFGEGIDAASAQHLAATLRKAAGQVWVSTRRSSAAEPFSSEELIRLTRSGGDRRAHQGEVPVTKADRLAARHLHLQLLPAAASRSLVIVEGPHDRAALEAIARQLFLRDSLALPAAYGIGIIHAGGAEDSGGVSAIPRLALTARKLGFRVVSVLDWDVDDEQKEAKILQMALVTSDAVVRLPRGFAIERVLLDQLDDEIVRKTVLEVATAFHANLESWFPKATGKELEVAARKFLKGSGGLHAQFVEALPQDVLPPRAIDLLRTVIAAATGELNGHKQL